MDSESLRHELTLANSANFALRRENEMLTGTLKLQRTVLEHMDALDARPLRTIIAERAKRNLLATKIAGIVLKAVVLDQVKRVKVPRLRVDWQ